MSGWDYSKIGLIVWLALPVYLLTSFWFFNSINKSSARKRVFNLAAYILVVVHVVLLGVLAFFDGTVASRRLGVEAWVCEKQVKISEPSSAARLFRQNRSYLENKELVIHQEEKEVLLNLKLKEAGVSVEEKKVDFAVDKEFELKVSSEPSYSWLKEALNYNGEHSSPRISVENGSLACADGLKGTWNVFYAKVDNSKKEYTWQKISLADLGSLKLNILDGGFVSDCLILDYGDEKQVPEYKCAELLRNDKELCPLAEIKKCEYKEVVQKTSLQNTKLNNVRGTE